MARTGRGRVCALAALGALAACWTASAPAPRAVVLSHLDAEVEGGGALRTARKLKALSTTLQFLKQHSGRHMYGSQFDTNAIGESWGRSAAAMGHWVDKTAPSTASRLEDELMAQRIGRRSDSHRQAMRMKRLARQRELNSRVSKPVNAMEHWTDRPAAIQSPELLEGELMAMKVGGRVATEGKRYAMHLKRVATRPQAFRAPLAPVRAPREQPGKGAALFSSHYDTNAVGERFRGSESGERLSPEQLESKLAAFKVGRQAGKEGRREQMRLRREQRAKAQ